MPVRCAPGALGAGCVRRFPVWLLARKQLVGSQGLQLRMVYWQRRILQKYGIGLMAGKRRYWWRHAM